MENRIHPVVVYIFMHMHHLIMHERLGDFGQNPVCHPHACDCVVYICLAVRLILPCVCCCVLRHRHEEDVGWGWEKVGKRKEVRTKNEEGERGCIGDGTSEGVREVRGTVEGGSPLVWLMLRDILCLWAMLFSGSSLEKSCVCVSVFSHSGGT